RDCWRGRVAAAGAGDNEVAVRAQWNRSAGKNGPEAVSECRGVYDPGRLLGAAEESQSLVRTATEQGERDRELVYSVVRTESRARTIAPGAREARMVREAWVVRGILHTPESQGTVVHPMRLIRGIPSEPALNELVLVPVRRHRIVPRVERERRGVVGRQRRIPDGIVGHVKHRRTVFHEEIGGQCVAGNRRQVDEGRVVPFAGRDRAVK